MASPGTTYGTTRPAGPGAEPPSVTDLISDALDQASTLVRAEIRLAQGEAVAKAKQAAMGLGLLAGALVLALACAVMLLVTVMVVLAEVGVPTALAAILALLLGLGGTGGLAWAGLQRMKADAMRPERTMRQLRRDRQMIKEQAR